MATEWSWGRGGGRITRMPTVCEEMLNKWYLFNSPSIFQRQKFLESKLEQIVHDVQLPVTWDETNLFLPLTSSALTLINCFIISTDNIWNRIQLRNELDCKLIRDKNCSQLIKEKFCCGFMNYLC